MALFKSVPAVSTQKDTTGPMKKVPSGKYKEENTKAKSPMSDEEAEAIVSKKVKPLVDEPDPVVEDDFVVPEEETKVEEEPVVEEEPQVEEKVEVEKKKEEVIPKKVMVSKPVEKEEPKAEKPKSVEVKPEPKKEEVKAVEAKAEPVVEEQASEPQEEKQLTLAERRILNLQKAREARLKQQEKENNDMATTKTTKTETAKKPAPKPKKAVDMSKMVMTAKKPTQAASGKTVYHVSKRGESREDRVWKVFIQESDKVIKLFDYQADALEYAKSLAKNKNDGSYVILHGLDGKIRKY